MLAYYLVSRKFEINFKFEFLYFFDIKKRGLGDTSLGLSLKTQMGLCPGGKETDS
jgi:hypothetical protein